MNGQWIGFTRAGATNNGFIILNFLLGSAAEARVIFYDFNLANPGVTAKVSFVLNNDVLDGRLSNFEEWDSRTRRRLPREENETRSLRSGVVRAELAGNKIEGHWETNIGTTGSFSLINRFYLSDGEGSDEHRPYVQSIGWKEFKRQVDGEESDSARQIIYRGQSGAWPLRTSYCRAGGTCLRHYLKDCLSDVSRHINSESNHKYSLKKDEDVAALMNLAQHHGYPTPILDWTESPFVAAFFAFESAVRIARGQKKVSIFQMNLGKDSVSDDFARWILEAPFPIIKIGRFPAFDNNRALPQQAVGLFSNIDDIEEMIRIQGIQGKESMQRWDIPLTERDLVMRDLRRMGITAASMFPGLDGICRSLKEQHFLSQ